jgi:hypothetical protein
MPSISDIQLAVNYSTATADLLRSGQIRFDRFKCPAWPDLVATAQAIHACTESSEVFNLRLPCIMNYNGR